jgi:hypothetical protein
MGKSKSLSLSLRLIDETPTTVTGEDEFGECRVFQKADLHSCIVSRKYESVSLVIEWQKLKATKRFTLDCSPESEKAVVKKERRCLNCRHTFMAHPSSYICDPCKNTVGWRMGGEYSLSY